MLISHMINRGNADMTAQMPDASFPTVAFLLDGGPVNTLHGYSEERDWQIAAGYDSAGADGQKTAI